MRLTELTLHPKSDGRKFTPLSEIDPLEWQAAVHKFTLLKPLLVEGGAKYEDVELVAKQSGKSVRTVYRWVERYNEHRSVVALLRTTRSDKGSKLLPDEIETIVEGFLAPFYLVEERPSIQALFERIEEECKRKGLKPPHRNTVANRVNRIDLRHLVRGRMGRNEARKLAPTPGKFPGADYPNAVVQIDHTPVDIILVDSNHRLPIGRPNLTLAIDVATKMVNGYYLSLDPVGALSAGLCISHAVTRKDLWLAKKGIEAAWPIHGKMNKIHVDNAKEFQGTMLKRACDENDIILEWRPKGAPNYGPHIERSFRTFMSKVHTLPGTTFSSVAKKLDYDSEGRACMTIDEFDQWFALFLSTGYHNKPHEGNDGIPPIKLYHRYVHGTDTQLGVGFPAALDDEEKFRFDFMPFVKRTIQRAGVEWNHLFYYAPVLRSYLGVKDPATKKSKMYIFAYDPRDLTFIYFYDEESRVYHPISHSDNRYHSISIWEMRMIKKAIKKDPDAKVDTVAIHNGAQKMREVLAESIEKTSTSKKQLATQKKNRRDAERQRQWSGVHQAAQEAATSERQQDDDPAFDDEDDVIVPFDDIRV